MKNAKLNKVFGRVYCIRHLPLPNWIRQNFTQTRNYSCLTAFPATGVIFYTTRTHLCNVAATSTDDCNGADFHFFFGNAWNVQAIWGAPMKNVNDEKTKSAENVQILFFIFCSSGAVNFFLQVLQERGGYLMTNLWYDVHYWHKNCKVKALAKKWKNVWFHRCNQWTWQKNVSRFLNYYNLPPAN